MPQTKRQFRLRRSSSRRVYKPHSSKRVCRSRSRLSHKVDINTCSMTSMRKLKIPATAIDAIMRYRRKFKCFTHINELLRIKSVDPETFRIINSNYKVEKSVEELRDTLHSRRRKKSILNSKSSTSQNRVHGSKSDPTSDRLTGSRRNSVCSGLSRSASAMSARSCSAKGSQNSMRNAAASRSMASLISRLWRKDHDSADISKSVRRCRSELSNDPKAARSLSKVGSDILSSLSSAFYESDKCAKPVRRSSSSTARWVTDVQKRSADKGKRLKQVRSSSRYKDRDRGSRLCQRPATSSTVIPRIYHRDRVPLRSVRRRRADKDDGDTCILM